MLVLARKVGERLLIGDQVVVTVVKAGPGGVRLGIEAPPTMPVVREELAAQIAAEERRQREAPDASGEHTDGGAAKSGVDRHS